MKLQVDSNELDTFNTWVTSISPLGVMVNSTQ